MFYGTLVEGNDGEVYVVILSKVHLVNSAIDSDCAGSLKSNAGFTLEMHAPCMQAVCRTHAACCILHTVVCRLHTGVIRATCRLHLEKYDLHFENVIDIRSAF